MSFLEVMPLDQAGRLELRQDAVNRRQANVLTGIQQRLVDILGALMTAGTGLEDIEYLHAR